MINIRRMWQPLTATPFLATAAHHEILPCESLQGWICCFWGGIIGAGASPMSALTSSTTLTKRRDASFKRVSAASATCAALRIRR